MTTIQPTEFRNKHGRTLRIESDGVRIVTPEREMAFFFDSPEQAHRAVLAILTGPGKVDPDSDVSDPARMSLEEAVSILRNHFAALDARAAAEAEAAELRAEALAILNAMNTDFPSNEWQDWNQWNQERALNAARAAREARRLHTNKETQHG
ncbi:hypothetical protein C6401_15350 [Arthrobacter woluwensis]|uniref:hypothetical protein n=1 Tax=Arthrobacter woluwensis TaxID=156980 RepID=UPI000D136AE1|nr:hypothetical protein [Arthrobacter woluwensis]PSS42931.1 hypothetical protein C6401_15350 [Arthrobacter woluwensis]